MKVLPALLLSALCIVTPACSEEGQAKPVVHKEAKAAPLHQQYRQWHDVCLQGDMDEIEKMIAQFEAQITANPKDDLARAYLGSAYALKAKHAVFPLTKLNSLKKGKELMEAAVTGSPDNPRVRMVRAIAYYRVPKRFDTRPTSISDFEKLLGETAKKNSVLQKNEKQAILYYAWKAFTEENHKDAAKAKSLCHKLEPDSEYGKLTK
ncbi:hypothetical protein Rhal01_03255 [Rubritalea halochordaticola]|uniref:Tetratricopeptide repeat protein n=1 Tax=Rubritalea halochordaticola TaxID=714537 RepID=A0ABP9V335_9BACT